MPRSLSLLLSLSLPLSLSLCLPLPLSSSQPVSVGNFPLAVQLPAIDRRLTLCNCGT